eukprot:CAMPEP_0184293638 /NCGR_PEP_ID=MMETSP1049-20130417/5013_1 /TAXON_ID=77928 /ORGANISM="Proteomonas sulcata, Strain CCMP704" /LENGTH=169 /DNA_ID=CAMNT_0026601663 /DNA_START=300 /DNA_END=809 /DNA_ORIENTATION=-
MDLNSKAQHMNLDPETDAYCSLGANSTHFMKPVTSLPIPQLKLQDAMLKPIPYPQSSSQYPNPKLDVPHRNWCYAWKMSPPLPNPACKPNHVDPSPQPLTSGRQAFAKVEGEYAAVAGGMGGGGGGGDEGGEAGGGDGGGADAGGAAEAKAEDNADSDEDEDMGFGLFD